MKTLSRFVAWLILPCALILLNPGFPRVIANESEDDDRVSFENDLIPIFTKLGCNSGACHGAAAGRGGFHLSLYGAEPQSDYRTIVYQHQGRRINLSHADRSLVLLKPSESIAHEGGYLIDEDDANYAAIQQWIEQGAQWYSAAELTRVDVEPHSVVVDSVPASVELRCTAYFSDGSQKDVTAWTVFTPEDSTAVSMEAPESAASEFAQATVLRRGRHVIVARFLNEVVPVEVIVPFHDSVAKSPPREATNFIDTEIDDRLQVLGLPASPPAAPEALTRRLVLDLTGRLPSSLSDATLRTLSSAQGADFDLRTQPMVVDREELVNALLSSDEFTDYWTLQWAKLLRIRPQGGRNPTQGAIASDAYHDWLHDQIGAGRGMDQIVRDLLLSEGDTERVGPANFYRTTKSPRDQTEFVSELFMGSRLRCANCHNHPLDHWTQDDYHGLAAIFAKVDMGRIVRPKPRGEVTHPKSSQPAQPRIPGLGFLESDTDAREQFTSWLTAPKNAYFAKAIVNRIWWHLMGRGLVEPVDDFRATNPSTHPRLLDRLSEDFVASGYDLRHTIRQILMTDAYARSTETIRANENDTQFLSHWIRKPLEPEVLADAISDVLGVAEVYDLNPSAGESVVGDSASSDSIEPAMRAVEIKNIKVPSRTLDVLGRCSREESCEGNSSSVDGLRQKLHLLNGPLLNARIDKTKGRLGALQNDSKTPMQVIAQFYSAAFNRNPSSQELDFWRENFPTGEPAELHDRLEDFVWSLLVSEEFVTNH